MTFISSFKNSLKKNEMKKSSKMRYIRKAKFNKKVPTIAIEGNNSSLSILFLFSTTSVDVIDVKTRLISALSIHGKGEEDKDRGSYARARRTGDGAGTQWRPPGLI